MSEMMKKRWVTLAVAGALAFSLPAFAGEATVQELNMGPGGMFVFAPDLVKVKPGDTVNFAATNKGHDVVSVDGMIPDGAEPFKAQMNEGLKVTFTKPGVYVFECKPHAGMGMIGAVVVGDPVNIDKLDAAKLPGKAKQKLQAIIDEIKKG